MIDHHMPYTGIIDNAALVVQNGIGINGSRHGTARVYFGLDFVRHGTHAPGIIRIRAVFGNRCIGKAMDRVTLSRGSIARAACIEWTARTIFQVWTKTVGRVGTAGNVWHACIVGDKAGFRFDKLVDTSGTTAVARAGGTGTAVENVLNG
jgi:hypothetical protein